MPRPKHSVAYRRRRKRMRDNRKKRNPVCWSCGVKVARSGDMCGTCIPF